MWVSLVRVPARREFHLREDGVGLDGSSINNNRFSELGAYACRFNNLSPSTASMNNPSPKLTHAYLDTPPVGPTPEPLEYAPPSYQNRTGGLLPT